MHMSDEQSLSDEEKLSSGKLEYNSQQDEKGYLHKTKLEVDQPDFFEFPRTERIKKRVLKTTKEVEKKARNVMYNAVRIKIDD